ncbi:zinc finger protein 414 [Nerophis ophidion]|uniref:zinc finger protein 414 n=1 Tax=Nerophis ophidion TaxID=159077 RepID=UPI002AE0377A|nr:zinc finger protein 414 [Nerophis ophidion]
MSSLQTADPNGHKGNRLACSLHGCTRVYTDATALESHVRDHEIPVQSLEGKVFNCCTAGCSCSFPNMQKLMEHTRRHHKPNLFFQCENCRTKLKSYRGLLTHLNTCSKVPRGKIKSMEPTSLQPVASTNPITTTLATNPNPPQLEAMSTPRQLTSNIPDNSLSDTTLPPILLPQCSLNQDTTRVPSGLGEEPR